MTISLSPKQVEAFDKIMAWFRDEDPSCKREFILAGYAGAGKTSLAKFIKAEVGDGTVFCAYTGKAVNVLRSKGCVPVMTIHSAIYSLIDHDKKRMVQLQEMLPLALGFERSNIEHELKRLKEEYRKPVFTLGGGGGLSKSKLIIVDEYSMLDHKVINDLRSLGKKILFMGDPFQLPPVSGECPLVPDLFLDEIHRQALESSIIRASKDIREGRALEMGYHGDFDYVENNNVAPDLYMAADQIICGRNQTRTMLNNRYRQALGIEQIYPVKGDKMICTKNNNKLKLFNGMIGHAVDDSTRDSDLSICYNLNFKYLDGDKDKEFMHLRVWEGTILGSDHLWDGYDMQMKLLQKFDYAYAITCHKSQGSEFGNVVLMNEPIGATGLLQARWLYTGITRGKQKVTLVKI